MNAYSTTSVVCTCKTHIRRGRGVGTFDELIVAIFFHPNIRIINNSIEAVHSVGFYVHVQ